MLQLHYFPGNASLTPHLLLEELGVPYELKLVDRDRQEHKSPAYLRLNSNGLIPVLVDGDLVLYETAAICLHLVDTHAASSLAPPCGTVERAHFYKWLVWLTNSAQATLKHYFYPERCADDAGAAAQVKAHAEVAVGAMLMQFDAELARHAGPWLLGATYTALDPYTLMIGRWTRGFAKPARDYPHLGAHLRRTLERPAVRRAFEREGLASPWV